MPDLGGAVLGETLMNRPPNISLVLYQHFLVILWHPQISILFPEKFCS